MKLEEQEKYPPPYDYPDPDTYEEYKRWLYKLKPDDLCVEHVSGKALIVQVLACNRLEVYIVRQEVVEAVPAYSTSWLLQTWGSNRYPYLRPYTHKGLVQMLSYIQRQPLLRVVKKHMEDPEALNTQVLDRLVKVLEYDDDFNARQISRAEFFVRSNAYPKLMCNGCGSTHVLGALVEWEATAFCPKCHEWETINVANTDLSAGRVPWCKFLY
jgi:hypothetical protein